MYLIANYLCGQRVVSSYSLVNCIVYWMEKHNQPWSLSMLAIAKASLTPSNDFILSRMNKLNEYVPSSSAMPFHWGQVCAVVCVHLHKQAYISPHTDGLCRYPSLSWLMNTHKTLSIIIKTGIQEFGLQMPDLIDGDLTGLLQAEASSTCLVEVVLLPF